CRAPRDRVAHELVAVFVRAAQREEQAALPHLARVGVKRGERLADLGAADLAAARRLEDLEEAQPHFYPARNVISITLISTLSAAVARIHSGRPPTLRFAQPRSPCGIPRGGPRGRSADLPRDL